MNWMEPAEAVVFVLLDGFRHDYLDRTRFLRRLARRSAVGRLEEPFGFCPRAAYFGGLTAAETGYTNVFRHDPAGSPFAWTRELFGAGDRTPSARLRAEILRRSRERVPAFAAAYLDPAAIPADRLADFDVAEREAPWSARAGYRSLFHLLDAAHEPWLQVAWPYAGWDGLPSDRNVAGRALAELTPAHRFAFLHLPELDGLGHRFGPGSREVQAAIDEADALCECLVDRISELHRDPVIVFAGDHGMLPVVRRCDAEAALEATGLRWGHDFAYFIDSTMVRLWSFTAAARTAARAALAGAGGGHWLTEAEWSRWELTGIDPRNGHDIFLADPGVAFSPSFFDGPGAAAPVGMHGYAPDVADNQGLFLAWRPRCSGAAGAGVVAARRLFPSFLSWLGRDPREYTTARPLAPVPIPAVRWTARAHPAGEALVGRQLATIAERIGTRAPRTAAVIVAGGFGRGEGATGERGGAVVPLNDYDVVAVGATDGELAGLADELARELGLDFVDLWPRPGLEPARPLSQFDFDLRYGARLLAGDPLAIERLPRPAPVELGVDEGVFQLGNRCGGLLLGLTGYADGADTPENFRGRQLAKFLIAIADCWLMAQGDYHPSYAIRRDRFGALAPAAGFAPGLVRAVEAAFAAKLADGRMAVASADEAGALAASAWSALIGTLGWRATDEAGHRLERAVRRLIQPGEAWLAKARQCGLVPQPAAGRDTAGAAVAVYRACVAGVAGWDRPAAERAAGAAAILEPHFSLAETPGAAGLWPALAATWLAFFH